MKTLAKIKIRRRTPTGRLLSPDGRPAKAVAAFHEYRELGEQDVHGELRPEKCMCYAPGCQERCEEWAFLFLS